MIYYANNTSGFLKKLRRNEKKALFEIGVFGKKKMDTYVPVDTSYLKSRNEIKINKLKLYLQNDCYYAKFQEFGTYKMKAQPFIRPSILNHRTEVTRIFIDEMGRDM